MTKEKKEPKVEAKVAQDTPQKELVTEVETKAETVNKPLAKAGRRSSKAVAEAEVKTAKEKRKAEYSDDKKTAVKKPIAKPARSRAERAGKKYREAAKLVDKDKLYSLAEAAALAVKTSITEFDSTVEIHLNLNVDPKQADQNIRETVVLPAGTGKALRVAVLAEAGDTASAEKAGADLTSADELFQMLDKEEANFDVLIATPAMMAKLGKYARLLGPKGLMPNPKSGTVTSDVSKAVTEAKAGRVEYRVDAQGIIHLAIGKVSFGPKSLAQNAEAVLSSVKSAKPASVKGSYLASVYITTAMGPGIRVTV